jgi:hypothetical protein
MPKKLKRLKYYRVMFHDGMKHLPPVMVVANSKTQARMLAQSSVPPSLYGPNVVFLKAQESPDLPIVLKPEDFELIAEKAGIHL